MRKVTKRPLLLAASAAALLALGGCVAPGGYYGDGYYDGDDYYGDDYYYDGYYDGFYGPFTGGYWAVDGFFYYWLRDRYYRDDHRHFQRRQFPGSQRFRGDRDGPSRWRHRYQPPHGQPQWPAPAHPPRRLPRQGGQQPDNH
jgi:hypothetical protein